MARARLISKSICASPRFHAVGDDSARLSYLLLLTHAYSDGRIDGDPCYVRSLIYPRRTDVTDADVQRHLDLMEEARMIIQYTYANGTRKAIQFEKFAEHQPNLRGDREAPSRIPPPPEPELLPQDAGATPAKCRSYSRRMPELLPQDAGATPAKCRSYSRRMPELLPQNAGSTSAQIEIETEIEIDKLSNGEGGCKGEGEELPPKAPPRGARCAYPDDFLQFWDAYPKTRRVGKGAALKAWRRHRAARPPTEKIISVINALKQTEQWMRDGGQFIPHPATWLNRSGWDDEVPTLRAKSYEASKARQDEFEKAKAEKAQRLAEELKTGRSPPKMRFPPGGDRE